jgi:DNA polymerase-3 subunit delta'
MAFKDIKGQKDVIEFFRNSVNRNKLSHAYLFSGAEGLGKTLLAQTLAKFLSCENPLRKGDSLIDCCDRCISCRKIEASNHPDLHWIDRPGKISIDDIRSIQKAIALTPYEARFKVFIILEVERMTEQAANSLLKTLEEPPDSSLLILTCTNTGALLPTIISRCQVIKFYPLNYEMLKEILSAQYKLKQGHAHFLSAQAQGRIGRALSLKDKDSLNKKNRLIDQVFQSTFRGPAHKSFNIRDKNELTDQIRYLLNWCRDILVFKSGVSSINIINVDRIEKIKSWADRLSFAELEEAIQGIEQAHRLIEQNVNRKLALEVMLGQIRRLGS